MADLAREIGTRSIGVTASSVGHALRHIGKSTICSTSCGCRGVSSAVDVIVGVAGNADWFSGCASDGVGVCFVRVLNHGGGAWIGGIFVFCSTPYYWVRISINRDLEKFSLALEVRDILCVVGGVVFTPNCWQRFKWLGINYACYDKHHDSLNYNVHHL